MTQRDPANSTDSLRAAIESVADQLCNAVDGNFDFRVKVASSDQSIEKLQMLINFVLDAARRGIQEQHILNDELRVTLLQLEHSIQLAEAANQAKSDFLANMSHELRTPLTAILGFTDVLDEAASAEQKEKLGVIHRNGTQLLHIVNDVLDLSTVEAGTVSVIAGDVEIVPMLQDITRGFAVQVQQKRIELTCRSRTPIPATISTDALRARQILTNLVGNAIKFTPRGSVRVEASFTGPPENNLHIDIIDTGVGIAAKEADRIFDPFSQADNSNTRDFGGTGLGLTISRRYAQLLGGDVALLRSERDGGSHFRFWLPCQIDDNTSFVEFQAEEIAAAKNLSSIPAAEADCAPLAHTAVLLVEDGIDNQRLIKHILTKHGAHVTTAGNGRLALDAFETTNKQGRCFDVVLMDMQMPVMDGYTATRALRDRGYQTPIIALTAHAMTGDREKCLNVGCTDYATKPIEPKKLVDLILTTATPQNASALT